MTKSVAKKETTAVATQTDAPRGLEEPTAKEDLQFPRARLLQKMSPDLDENPELKSGQIINSLTREELSETFVPITKFTSWTRFNPRDETHPNFDSTHKPGEMIWTSTDPNDERVLTEGEWDGDNPPLATKFLNFYCLFKDI